MAVNESVKTAIGAAAVPARVAILGFGTVGRSVARILCDGVHGLRLACVFNRNVARKRVGWVGGDVRWTDTIEDAFADDVDIVVELVGGIDPAVNWIRRALSAGKSVVTANKQAIAHRGAELFDLARTHGARIGFEASVGGGIPAIRGIQEGLAGDELRRVQGILNGTCNFILTQMETASVAFDAAVAEAQAEGYAEADPSADLDGLDAQAKLAILSAIGLRRRVAPEAIPTRSICGLQAADIEAARRLGCVIRQVSAAESVGEAGVRAAVGPVLVPLQSRLAQVAGNENVVVVDGVRGGQTAFVGYGAGGDPTAVAVVSDLLSIAAGDGRASTAVFPSGGPRHDVVAAAESTHYVRVVGGAAAACVSACDIRVDQQLGADGAAVVTAPCSTAALESAKQELAGCAGARIAVALPMIT